METLIRDSRLALRRLRMAPAFTMATTLTLSLGIGATTSIFTLAHAVLLKSLPVARPDELYRMGKEAHCCFLDGCSQDKEFSLVSYDYRIGRVPGGRYAVRHPARGQFRDGPNLRR